MTDSTISPVTATTEDTGKEAAAQPDASIISPVVDFFMLGGLTLFIIPLVMLPVWNEQNINWLYFVSYCLIFVANLPHFIHSYQLLYRKFPDKLRSADYGRASKIRMAISGLIVPVVLIGFLTFGALQPTSTWLGYSVNLMLFLIGWHYVKQGYGILIALSVRKKVFFSDLEKKILLINAYLVWIHSWVVLNGAVKADVFHDIPFNTVGLPPGLVQAVQLVFVCWTFFAAVVLFRKFDERKTLSYNGLAAYFFAVYPWVFFAFAHPNLIIFVPALHSLQYMLIVWKMVYERTRDELGQAGQATGAGAVSREIVLKKMVPFLMVGFGAGALFFTLLPLWLDRTVPYNQDVFGSHLFVFCFLIFLNIHHYFIDFAIWRRDNPEMKYLFK